MAPISFFVRRTAEDGKTIVVEEFLSKRIPVSRSSTLSITSSSSQSLSTYEQELFSYLSDEEESLEELHNASPVLFGANDDIPLSLVGLEVPNLAAQEECSEEQPLVGPFSHRRKRSETLPTLPELKPSVHSTILPSETTTSTCLDMERVSNKKPRRLGHSRSSISPRRHHHHHHHHHHHGKTHRRVVSLPEMDRRAPPNSLEALQASLEVSIGRFGPIDYRVGRLHNHIGNFYFWQQDFDKAFCAYQRAARCHNPLDRKADSEHVAAALTNMATVCWSKGDVTAALNLLDKAIKIHRRNAQRKGMDPEACPAIGGCLYQMGLAHLLQRDGKAALDALDRSMNIHQKAKSSKMEIARVLDAFGKAYMQADDLDKAETYHSRALDLKRQARGGNSDPSVRATMMNMGAVHWARQHHDKALTAYTKVMNAIKSELANGDDLRLTKELGETLEAMAAMNGDEATIARNEALLCYREIGWSDDHPRVAKLLERKAEME